MPGRRHLDLRRLRGHALIDRALYLPGAAAADDEHRELAGVPEEVMFATKPQLAGALLQRARERGIRASFVAGDEVYGGRDLRLAIHALGMGYVLAVRANHTLTVGSGRVLAAADAARLIPAAPGSGCAPATAPREAASTTGRC